MVISPAPRSPSSCRRGDEATRAATQLVRWESRYGWTRPGWGPIPEQEVSLASVLARRLQAPDMWVTTADRYLHALDKTEHELPGTVAKRSSERRSSYHRRAVYAVFHLRR